MVSISKDGLRDFLVHLRRSTPYALRYGIRKGEVGLGARATKSLWLFFRCLREKPLVEILPARPAARIDLVDCAAARPPRWGSPRKRESLNFAQPSLRGIAPGSPPVKAKRLVPRRRGAHLDRCCAWCFGGRTRRRAGCELSRSSMQGLGVWSVPVWCALRLTKSALVKRGVQRLSPGGLRGFRHRGPGGATEPRRARAGTRGGQGSWTRVSGSEEGKRVRSAQHTAERQVRVGGC